ncbi:MAG: hypothetical protein J3K34DRAFT_502460 [Monoraphidium minutum]|nr:MAG: hypothetical protein J3K34DRAFT_502460 [Monoraphidium minutum]
MAEAAPDPAAAAASPPPAAAGAAAAAAAAAAPREWQPLQADGKAVPGLLLRHTPDRGYHVVSTRWMDAGTTLLREAPLAASTVGCGALPSYCQRCLTPLSGVAAAKRAACEGCQALVYCSTYCRGRDAPAHGASGECHLLRAPPSYADLGPWLRDACLALRLLRLAPPPAPPLAAPREGDLAPEVVACASAAARAARAALVAADPAAAAGVGEADVVRAVLAAAANSLEFDLSHPGDPGAEPACPPLVLYRAACRLNHSCRPNAAFHFAPGGKITLRLTRDAGCGTEIAICYLDAVASDGAARRAQLRARYGFDCACARCEEGARRERLCARRARELPPAAAAAAAAARVAAAEAVTRAEQLFIGQDDAAGAAAALESGLLPALLPPRAGGGGAAGEAPLALTSPAALQGLALLASARSVLASPGDAPQAGGAGGGAGAAWLAVQRGVAAAALLAMAGEELVFEGETAALRHAGGFWCQLARACAAALPWAPPPPGGGGGGGGGERAGGGPRRRPREGADEDGGPWPAGLPSAHPGLAGALRGLWVLAGGALLAAPGDGAPPPQPQQQQEAGAAGEREEGAWPGLEGQAPSWLRAWGSPGRGAAPAAAPAASASGVLEAAAAHAGARARALLSHHYGPMHAAAEAAAFGPLLCGALPYAAAARVAQAAAAIFEEAPHLGPL